MELGFKKKAGPLTNTYIRVAVAEIGKGRIFDSGLGLSKGQARKTATRQTYNQKILTVSLPVLI
jgi:hypothetical protein